MIEKGDLVIKGGKHEAKVCFVEDVNAESILLVNGVRDEYFEGKKDIEVFHKQFRLLAKAEHLIKEEKRYYLRLATKIDVYEDRRYLNMDIPNEKYTLSENKDDAYYKAIFTESEISKMDITGFQKVEVGG